ncbi:hypothetical protein M406DRAFT_357489 [Cryphonectria parasitica EP155]|uniref:Uncharacterized protein n=1 Tax=Cryphonectria parasitica (strain ATCC 38755 / EP155) TaxID=660469 RepID=A0A9P4XWC7_CRYP1|nr:uncharacterized protein M406DRAFT_357489 [Cryphonectria parasitica EP155]KAF3762517.1 hypothetical protein M406DRAFT_357489 [Cryphonectria parasitica EP155]
MSADAIMLDSPAQTPDSKSHRAGSLSAISGAFDSEVGVPDVAVHETGMSIDSQANVEDLPAVGDSWDTKKWREDAQAIQNKLQHQHYNIAKHRDPLDKPLVTRPPGLSADAENRLRQYYQQKVAATKAKGS